MTDRFQRKIILYLALITIGILLLAAGLPTLELRSGSSLPRPQINQDTQSTQTIPPIPETHLILKFPLAVIFIVVLALLIAYLIKNLQFRKILSLAGLLLMIGCLLLLIDQIQLPTTSGSIEIARTTEAVPTYVEDYPPMENSPHQISTFVLIGLSVIAAAVVAALFLQPKKKSSKTNLLAEQADQALSAIRDGEDLGNIIIRCYLQMENIVKEEKGLERNKALTPREFEGQLAKNDIPARQIHQLTLLFEEARYGNAESDEKKKETAVECLTSIIQSCKPESDRNHE